MNSQPDIYIKFIITIIKYSKQIYIAK